MPWKILPHFSHRWSNTGPKLRYHFDCLLKVKVIAFSFFDSCLLPLRKSPKHHKSVDSTPFSFFTWRIRNSKAKSFRYYIKNFIYFIRVYSSWFQVDASIAWNLSSKLSHFLAALSENFQRSTIWRKKLLLEIFFSSFHPFHVLSIFGVFFQFSSILT